MATMLRGTYDTVHALSPATWSALDGADMDFSPGVLGAVEEGLWGDLHVRYLTIETDGQVDACLPVYFGTNLNINAMMPGFVQSAYDKAVRIGGPSVKTRFALAGSLVSEKGWMPMRRGRDSSDLVREMTSHIDDFSRQVGAQVGLLKDIHCDFPHEYRKEIEGKGYYRLYSVPTVVIHGPFADFDDYLASLRKNWRRHCRKVMRNAQRLFELEALQDFEHAVDEVFPLFRATFLRAKYKLEEAIPQFVRACSRSTDPESELIVCRKGERVVGALLTFHDGYEQLNKRIGIDYTQEETPLIYSALMYEGIRRAISRGARRIYLGQTTYVPKLRLGGDIEDQYFYVKAYDKALKPTMPLQTRWSRRYRAERVLSQAEQGVSV